MLPHGPYFDPSARAAILMRNPTADFGRYTLQEYEALTQEVNVALETSSEHYGRNLQILDPAEYLCPNKHCDFYTGGYPNYTDESHLTGVGVLRLRPMFDKLFKDIARGSQQDD